MADLIQAGTHDVHVKETYLGKSKVKGTPYVGVVLQDDQGCTLTWYGYLSDAAVERTIQVLQDIGWNAEEDNWEVAALDATPRLVNVACQIVVEDEEYEGKVRPKVKWLNPEGGGTGVRETMAPEEVKSFSSEIRKRILASKGPQPSKAPSRSSAPATARKARPAQSEAAKRINPSGVTSTLKDEDIPF